MLPPPPTAPHIRALRACSRFATVVHIFVLRAAQNTATRISYGTAQPPSILCSSHTRRSDPEISASHAAHASYLLRLIILITRQARANTAFGDGCADRRRPRGFSWPAEHKSRCHLLHACQIVCACIVYVARSSRERCFARRSRSRSRRRPSLIPPDPIEPRTLRVLGNCLTTPKKLQKCVDFANSQFSCNACVSLVACITRCECRRLTSSAFDTA